MRLEKTGSELSSGPNGPSTEMNTSFFAVLVLEDGKFVCTDLPDRLRGYKPRAVYLFGTPNYDSPTERELSQIALSMGTASKELHGIT